MHRRLIADACEVLNLTAREVFMKALENKRGMSSVVIKQTAMSHFEEYERTGRAPDFAQDFAIGQINQARWKLKMRQVAKPRSASRVGPSGNLVEELEDGA